VEAKILSITSAAASNTCSPLSITTNICRPDNATATPSATLARPGVTPNAIYPFLPACEGCSADEAR
jgi:hypothetical protein